MISNPKRGMQVKVNYPGLLDYHGRIGRIDYVHRSNLSNIDYVGVKFDDPRDYNYFWLGNVDMVYSSPEEEKLFQDQERRKIHADKYL